MRRSRGGSCSTSINTSTQHSRASALNTDLAIAARWLHAGGRIYCYRSSPVLDPGGRTDATGQPLLLGTTLAIDPGEARTVRQIFEWFAGSVSLRAIAHRLNADHVPFPAAPTRRG